jgi:hypothetical protein
MKNYIFRDISTCGVIKVYGRFGGTNFLHLQARKVSRASEEVCIVLTLRSST